MRLDGNDGMDTQVFLVVRGDLFVEVEGGRRWSGAVDTLSRGSVMFVEDCNRSIVAVLLVDCSECSHCANVP